MASTDKELTQAFYSEFQAARTELTGRLDALRSSRPPSANVISAISIDLSILRKKFTDAVGYLPAYDQRQCEDYLKSAEQILGELQAAAAAKPKFAFKRRTNKAQAAAAAAQLGSDASSNVRDDQAEVENERSSSHLSLSKHSHKCLSWTSLPPIASDATDLAISDLEHCVVNLLSDEASNSSRSLSALHIRNLSNTLVILPPIKGSALIHDLTNCIVALGCHQFRMHNSSNVQVYLAIQSNPIIEHCSSITFAAYPSSLLSAAQSLPESKHLSVQDFSHIRATPSPNWLALPAQQTPPPSQWAALTDRSDAVVARLTHVLPSGIETSSA